MSGYGTSNTMISKVVWQMETNIPDRISGPMGQKEWVHWDYLLFILFSDTKSLVKCRLDDLEGGHPEWYIIYRKKDGSGEKAGDPVLLLKL